MAARRARSFWRRPTNQFLVALVAFVLCGWLSYYALSCVVGRWSTASGLVNLSDTPRQEPIVSGRVGSTGHRGESNPVTLHFLAAESQSATSQQKPEAKLLIDIPETSQTILKQANDLVRAQQLIAARKLLTNFLDQYGDHDACEPLWTLAVQIGQETILSPKVFPDDPFCYTYRVKPGESLSQLAAKCAVPHQFIAWINRISDPRKMRADQEIKLVRGPVNATVTKHNLFIYLSLQNVPFAKYPVGLGKDGCTPLGSWLVEDRVKDPVYNDPDTGKTYGQNDPENPTGGYWIRLKGLGGEALGKTGFGIHGTIDPGSIGKFMSRGCIRMQKADIAKVFDMLQPGASKVITKP